MNLIVSKFRDGFGSGVIVALMITSVGISFSAGSDKSVISSLKEKSKNVCSEGEEKCKETENKEKS